MRGWALVMWGVAVVLGCSTTFIAKIMFAQSSKGLHGAVELFKKPIAMESLLFIGMSMGLPLHAAGLRFGGAPLREVLAKNGRSMVLLALPAMCDIAATALLFLGLLYLSMSQTQLLRSSIAIFSTLIRIPMLGKRPAGHMVRKPSWGLAMAGAECRPPMRTHSLSC